MGAVEKALHGLGEREPDRRGVGHRGSPWWNSYLSERIDDRSRLRIFRRAPSGVAAEAPDRGLDVALGDRRNRMRWVDAGGHRQDRAVEDVEPGIAEDLAIRVGDAGGGTVGHRAAAQIMHRSGRMETLP